MVWLKVAEDNRRVGDGTFNASPGQDPDEDYAAATTLITQAMHHLDESIPNGQLIRTKAAFIALSTGCEHLRDWLAPRCGGFFLGRQL